MTIARIGSRGDGIAESAGGRLYVPLTVPGDRVRVQPVEMRSDGRAAELLAMLAPGPDRAEPACPHFGTCGGCALQHLTDAAYVDWKLSRLTGALRRHGVMVARTDPLVRVPPGGRRRATLAAECTGTAPPRLGFRMRRGHAIVDLATCPVLAPPIVGALPPLRDLLADLLPPGRAMEIAVTAADNGLDVLLAGLDPPDLAARERLAAFAVDADLARLTWQRAAGAPPEPIAERRPPTVRFAGVPVQMPPGAFLQASTFGEAALIAAVGAGVGERATVADLFAGVGTLSLPLARRGAPVTAVDSDDASLRALAAAARRAGLAVTCQVRDLATSPLRAEELAPFAAVVFDPPRAGARAQAEALAASDVRSVVAVSCNPETFARDARTLADGGFRLTRLTPVDQFLWSPHLELAAVFAR